MNITHTETWGEFIAKAEEGARESEKSLLGPWSSTRQNNRATAFTGTRSWKEAHDLALNGWQAKVPEFENLASVLRDSVYHEHVLQDSFEAKWDVCGSEVDVAAYLSGAPECMIEAEPIRIAKVGRAVRLIVQANYTSGTNVSAVEARGAAIVALVDILRHYQHPLEVWAVKKVDNDSSRKSSLSIWIGAVQVQAADEPVNIGRLAYVFSHPSFLRRTMFARNEAEPNTVANIFHFRGNGYGTTADNISGIEKELPAIDGTNIVLDKINEYGKSWENPKWVTGWIEDQLRRIFGES